MAPLYIILNSSSHYKEAEPLNQTLFLFLDLLLDPDFKQILAGSLLLRKKKNFNKYFP
jgi:hypothetical protein